MKPDRNYARLEQAVEKISSGQREEARSLLQGLTSGALDPASSGEDLKTYLFATALLQRVDGQQAEQANLYLRRFEIPQIRLFNVLAEKFPLVRDAGTLANSILMKHLRSSSKAVLLDVGIGSGRQVVTLLEQMDSAGIRPSLLTVIGIEPSEETLAAAEKAIVAAGERAGIPSSFIGIAKKAEELDDADWSRIQGVEGDLLVNEAFAIHHVEGEKDQVLERIHALHPKVFVLAEPHSDHETGDLMRRFRNSWKHFGLAFEVIDRLEISDEEKRALKLQFFAREIMDILGNPREDARSERHETGSMWAERLRRSGFHLLHENVELPAKGAQQGLLRVAPKDKYIGLDFEDETIVAVLCAA